MVPLEAFFLFFSKILAPWLFGPRVDCVVKSRMDVHVIVLVVSLLLHPSCSYFYFQLQLYQYYYPTSIAVSTTIQRFYLLAHLGF